jgi:ABC-type polysaccharide/polyol phosphate export permease
MTQRLQIRNSLHATMKDVRFCFERRHSWFSLGRQEITSSYRRTMLGPLWISIQQIAFVLGIGLLYSQLFRVSSRDLIPIVVYGVMIWGLITSLVVGSTAVFIDSAAEIKSTDLPPLFYACRLMTTQVLTFLHSTVALFLIPILYGVTPSPSAIVVVPVVLLLIAVNGLMLCMWLGMASARFRDIRVGIGTVMQVSLFLSPVFWSSDLIRESQWATAWNPFAWIIESFRNPLIANHLEVGYLIALGILTTANLVAGTVANSKYRSRVSYWI